MNLHRFQYGMGARGDGGAEIVLPFAAAIWPTLEIQYLEFGGELAVQMKGG